MELNDSSDLVFSVLRAHNTQWHVTTQDSRQLLASFDNPQAACAWAIARAKPQRGKVFVEELAGSTRAFTRNRAPEPELFEYSMPVTWTESADSRFKTARR